MSQFIIKDFIKVDGETYWHYTFGGKYTCTKFITIQGINYYNSNKPLEFNPLNTSIVEDV